MMIERMPMANSGLRDYNYNFGIQSDVIIHNYAFQALRVLNEER